MTKIQELIMLSDILDAANYHKESSVIDNIIKTSGEPKDLVIDFVSSLKHILNRAATKEGEFLTITEKSIPEIFKIIDWVLENKTYSPTAHLPPETNVQYSDPIEALTARILEKEDAISDIDNEMKQETDKEKIEYFQRSRSLEVEDLKELYDQVRNLERGYRAGDKEKYEKFKQIYHERKSYRDGG